MTPNSDIIHKYPNRLMALHLHDNNGAQDSHTAVYSGSVNWERVSYGIAKANKVNLDAEVKLKRPDGMHIIDEKNLLELYKETFSTIIKLERQIEMHRKNFEEKGKQTK